MTRAALVLMLTIYSSTAMAEEPAMPNSPLPVTLYYPGQNDQMMTEPTNIPRDYILENEIKSILELLAAKSSRFVEVVPRSAKIETVFIDKQRTAYINFNEDITAKSQGGITTEVLAVASICKTVLNNFNVDGVRLLQKGKELKTLAGHVDVESKITRQKCELLSNYR